MVTKKAGGEAALALVMAGLVPAIHVFLASVNQDVDARDKRGHDGWNAVARMKRSEIRDVA